MQSVFDCFSMFLIQFNFSASTCYQPAQCHCTYRAFQMIPATMPTDYQLLEYSKDNSNLVFHNRAPQLDIYLVA